MTIWHSDFFTDELASRELNSEHRSYSDRAVDLDRPSMPLDNAMNNREPQPRAFTHIFGRKKRIEDAWQDLSINALTIVRNGYNHLFLITLGRDPNLRVSSADNGLRRIGDQVDENLAQLTCMSTNLSNLSVISLKGNVLLE